MAHNYNDDIIARHVPEKGFFLEIGCWDGEHISQTVALERKGWTGICVDPFPKNFENRKCKLLKWAIDTVSREADFIKVTIDRRHGGDVSYFSGFAHCIAKNETIRDIIFNHCDYETVKIETMPVEDLFNLCPKKIDFISIDTEGSEVDILANVDFKKYDIYCIMVEHNQVEKSKMQLMSIMETNGYYLAEETDIDYIFKKIR